MRYTITSPCGGCPFRRVGGLRLDADFIRRIIAWVAARSTPFDGDMPCHHTVRDYADRRHREESHCAGAVMFRLRHGRFAGRFRRLLAPLGEDGRREFEARAGALVWDSVEQWLAEGCIEAGETETTKEITHA